VDRTAIVVDARGNLLSVRGHVLEFRALVATRRPCQHRRRRQRTWPSPVGAALHHWLLAAARSAVQQSASTGGAGFGKGQRCPQLADYFLRRSAPRE